MKRGSAIDNRKWDLYMNERRSTVYRILDYATKQIALIRGVNFADPRDAEIRDGKGECPVCFA